MTRSHAGSTEDSLWSDLDAWLKNAAMCTNQTTCRLEDRRMARHLVEWINQQNLGFSPADLGSYPGFVGQNYQKVSPRILYVAVNPGKYSQTKWQWQKERLQKYHRGDPASRIFSWETDVVWNRPGGRNAKWQALFDGAGLTDWRDVALTNICLCPTHNDVTPVGAVIQRCFTTHLLPLTKILKPDVVIFLSMRNQEQIFEPARDALIRANTRCAIVPHPARRGVGQTADNLRRAIASAAHRKRSALLRRARPFCFLCASCPQLRYLLPLLGRRATPLLSAGLPA